MGRPWYEQGKFLHKKNSFPDFGDSAQHLIAEGYTRPAKLGIMGRSAGGLLMGAVLNMAPELFTAAIAGVPFMDVVSTMLDTSIPLTVGEFDEWGNPQDESYYHYMLSYSPYDQLEAKAYPHVLVTSGLNDPRVQYWEPTKWVAKIRTLKTDDNRILLKTNMGAGHAGASGRYDYLREIAFEHAFLLDALGMGEVTEELP
jgi:oligopeptidase B